jgi:hypothetical protein
MTVISQNINVIYTGTGSVGPFAFNFPISSADSLQVIQNSIVQPFSAYTVRPLNNDFDNGGFVVMNTPVPAGQTLELQRMTPLTQLRVFRDNLPDPMVQFEDGLDKLTEIVQELAADIAAGGGGTGVQTFVVAGAGIVVTGVGTATNPYVISLAAILQITDFDFSQAGELGQQYVNPTFVAAYNGVPTAVAITNTDGLASPTNLVSPFSSVTLAATFSHNTPATTTFTLTATNGAQTATATRFFTWSQRIFGGIGAQGANSSVAAVGNTALLSTGDALPTLQLGVEQVGQTFGPYNPSGQAIYLFLAGGTHTFVDANTGFPFAFNTPITVTFINQFGVTITMYLYQSTNALTGSFAPKVTS